MMCVCNCTAYKCYFSGCRVGFALIERPCPPAGILYGTMTLELGGKVTIECEKTKCSSELEFKLKVASQQPE